MPESYKLTQSMNWFFRNKGCGKNSLSGKTGKKKGVIPVVFGLSSTVGLDSGGIGKKHLANTGTDKVPEPLIKSHAFNSYLTLEAV
jgi:hypothetical protein